MSTVIAAIVAFIGLSVAADTIGGELSGWLPVLARWLIGVSTRRLPADCRQRYQEEWLYDINALAAERKLTALVWAAQTFLAARGIRRDLRLKDASRERVQVGMTYGQFYRHVRRTGIYALLLGSIFAIVAVTGIGPFPVVAWPMPSATSADYVLAILGVAEGTFILATLPRIRRRSQIPADAQVRLELRAFPPRLRVRCIAPSSDERRLPNG